MHIFLCILPVLGTLNGQDQVVHFEISSESYYKNHLSRPTWPRGASGINVGIGYDLGYKSKARIRASWADRIHGNGISRCRVITASGAAADPASTPYFCPSPGGRVLLPDNLDPMRMHKYLCIFGLWRGQYSINSRQ